MTELALSVKVAAARSGLSASTLRREMAAGRLPFIRKGGRVLILTDDLLDWLMGDDDATTPTHQADAAEDVGRHGGHSPVRRPNHQSPLRSPIERPRDRAGDGGLPVETGAGNVGAGGNDAAGGVAGRSARRAVTYHARRARPQRGVDLLPQEGPPHGGESAYAYGFAVVQRAS